MRMSKIEKDKIQHHSIVFLDLMCYDMINFDMEVIPLVRRAEEWNDVYDENRVPTGRIHRRGAPWAPGEYGLVVCVWVYDGRGHMLLTRRAPGKSFAGTWENSGGAAQAGETSLM